MSKNIVFFNVMCICGWVGWFVGGWVGRCLCVLSLYDYMNEVHLFQLLMFISGSKEHYRQLRDMHALQTNMTQVERLCKQAGVNNVRSATPLPYDSLITMVRRGDD